MPISPYIAALRQRVGHDLLLLPSVSVLPRDLAGRILLVRHADIGLWGTIGGAVEPDEDPAGAAVREAEEEAWVSVELTRLMTAVGGPQFRVTYPNGDQVSYVTIVYEARITSGEAAPDADETVDVAWVEPAKLRGLNLGSHALHVLTDVGLLPPAPAQR